MSPASRIPAEHLLRLTTLNLNHAPDEVERRTGLACDELGDLRPSVLCLQEVRFEEDGASAVLDAISAASGLRVASACAQHPTRSGALSGNAIMSSLPILEAGTVNFGTPDCQLTSAGYAVLDTTTGQALIVVSAHLAWGGDQEGTRLTQITAIDLKVRDLITRYEDRNPIAVLAGDFNTPPGSDTNRYLNGHGSGANGDYTFWTEAFAVAGSPEEAATVAASNYWARKTAKLVGIEFPEMLPDRRIDYVWTYGWAYGRPGCPVAIQRSFTDTTRYGFPASDHYGLTVDFWTPPVLAPVPALLKTQDDSLVEAIEGEPVHDLRGRVPSLA